MGIVAALGGGIASVVGGLGVAAGTAATIGSIAAPALIGAGVGALGSAITGGKPLQGALLGGVLGGAGGALGAFGGDLGPLGATAGDAASAADTAGAMFGGAPAVGSASGSVGDIGVLANGGQDLPLGIADAPESAGGISPLAASSAAASGGGGGGGGGGSGGLFGGKINTTSLLLGALSGVGSLMSKPQQYSGPLQTPAQSALVAQNQGPYWNQPINTNVPGRTAMVPQIGMPTSAPTPQNVGNTWYTYGSMPEQTFFGNNSLHNFGFARGGALGEWQTGGRSKHVRGPGTGVSDSVPARLSDGEFVLDYDDVARIGNPKNPSAPGANEAGARKLERDRGALAHLVGQAKHPPARAKYAMNEPRRRA